MDERPDRPIPTGPVRRGQARDVDPDPDDDPPLPPVVRIASRDRGPAVLAAALLVFVVLAVVKPWPSSLPSVGFGPVRTAASVAPTPSPTPDPLADLRRQCEEPLGWRVYTIEEWSEQTVRTWRSLEPAAVTAGPLDPAIPILPLGPVIDGVGYCSPWDGPERPPDGSTVAAWRVLPDGGGGLAQRMRLDAIAPTPPSVLGALFAPPPAIARPSSGAPPSHVPTIRPGATRSPAATARWPAGRYVFEVAAPSWSRWWSVEIDAEP